VVFLVGDGDGDLIDEIDVHRNGVAKVGSDLTQQVFSGLLADPFDFVFPDLLVEILERFFGREEKVLNQSLSQPLDHPIGTSALLVDRNSDGLHKLDLACEKSFSVFRGRARIDNG